MTCLIINFSTDYPVNFYSDSTKKLKIIGGPDLTDGVGVIMPPTPMSPFAPKVPDTNKIPNSSSCKKSTFNQAIPFSSYYEEQYSAPTSGNHQGRDGGVDSGTETTASEHHYDVPLVRSSMESPISSETHHLLLSHKQQRTPTLDSGVGGGIQMDSPMSSLDKSTRSASPLSSASEATSG